MHKDMHHSSMPAARATPAIDPITGRPSTSDLEDGRSHAECDAGTVTLGDVAMLNHVIANGETCGEAVI